MPAATIAIKPRTLSHTETAALPLVGVSALQGLKEYLKLSAGQKVLIHGGAGGIGSIAIQLAKHLDGYVATTTVSADDVEYVTSLWLTLHWIHEFPQGCNLSGSQFTSAKLWSTRRPSFERIRES